MHAIPMTAEAAIALFQAHRNAKPKGDEFYAAADAEKFLNRVTRVVPSADGKTAQILCESSGEWVERVEDATFRYLDKALKDATAGDLFQGGAAPIVVAAMKAMKGATEEKVEKEAPRLVEGKGKKAAGA